MVPIIKARLFFFLCSISFLNTFIFAQDRSIDKSLPSRYYLGTEEQVLLPVNILGLVQRPGQYMVPYRTDLISLIAFAGGFRDEAKITRIKIIRSARGSGQNGHQARVFNFDVKRFMEYGDQSQIPQLMPDDTIVVSGTTTRVINKVFDFVTKAVILAQLYFYIKVANDR